MAAPNSRALNAKKKLAVPLYYLKDTGTLCMTANTFGLAINTVSGVILEVCKAICKVLGPSCIFMPRNKDEMRHKVAEFESKFGMPQAFGCIDGTHIPLKRPGENSQEFYNYKGFFSLNMQAVCDYRGLFMDINCRWPGSVHDAKVFSNSRVNHDLKKGTIPGFCQSFIPGSVEVPNYLIGDPAYPLVPFCMKEYESCNTNEQVVFNNLLRSARNPIECTFGRLKAWWSILKKKIDLKLSSVPTIVYACCVLHNFCERKKIYVDEYLVQTQIEAAQSNERTQQYSPDTVYSYNTGEGEIIRNTLANYIGICLANENI